MTIETKFKNGDKFWAMDNNKPTQFNVFSINIRIEGTKSENIKILYSIVNGGSFSFDDKNCYATKEALLKSL